MQRRKSLLLTLAPSRVAEPVPWRARFDGMEICIMSDVPLDPPPVPPKAPDFPPTPEAPPPPIELPPQPLPEQPPDTPLPPQVV